MPHHHISLAFAAFAAVVSAAMWLDYFRGIDVFEKEKIGPLMLALFVGGCTPYISLGIYHLLGTIGFHENGHFWNDLLYSVFGIGLNEEISKMIGVVIVLFFLKKEVTEPIDVLIFAGVTALGFSMIENYRYFNNHGIKIITPRTFYSALEHIINTSIIVYGFYRQKLFKKGSFFLNAFVGLTVAVASHGLFDFFLDDRFTGYFTTVLSVIIYLVGINFWTQMLNNANNYSSFFDYNKIHYSGNLVYRLFIWYGLTLLIAFINNALIVDLRFSVITLIYSVISDGFLFFVVILRVSRFKMFKLQYFKVKPELPFYITKNHDEDFVFPFLKIPIKVRGESYPQYLLTHYMDQPVELNPIDHAASYLGKSRQATITHKYLLFDDVIIYMLSIPDLPKKENSLLVLKPQTSLIKEVGKRYPLEGLYELELNPGFTELTKQDYDKMKFLEWVYVKPIL